eukprot:CAMPEP_0117592780 /NCGR_PEP_ID=MMETSP0784-20121206/72264_1 /TAXON_ID=39447 /ORGANISM="" /LENGTH=464 /DNA_ID=CAMNT_0005394623 /DNA_START=37 /DNA_END=1433 /DNA_ORIENTATION=+
MADSYSGASESDSIDALAHGSHVAGVVDIPRERSTDSILTDLFKWLPQTTLDFDRNDSCSFSDVAGNGVPGEPRVQYRSELPPRDGWAQRAAAAPDAHDGLQLQGGGGAPTAHPRPLESAAESAAKVLQQRLDADDAIMRSGDSLASNLDSQAATMPIPCCLPTRASTRLEQEEEEELAWLERQKRTGASGRLVVYFEGDDPRNDFLLRGGSGRRVVVSAVQEGGPAAKAGVKPGDVLASIDGKKDFRRKNVEEIQRGMVAPVTLIFMGFVGKLHAEVRLSTKSSACGLSANYKMIPNDPTAQVVDEIVFKTAATPLFLAANSSSVRPQPRTCAPECNDNAPFDAGCGTEATLARSEGDADAAAGGAIQSQQNGSPSRPNAMYELSSPEARALVRNALSRTGDVHGTASCQPSDALLEPAVLRCEPPEGATKTVDCAPTRARRFSGSLASKPLDPDSAQGALDL